jgi:hypothetical protein
VRSCRGLFEVRRCKLGLSTGCVQLAEAVQTTDLEQRCYMFVRMRVQLLYAWRVQGHATPVGPTHTESPECHHALEPFTLDYVYHVLAVPALSLSPRSTPNRPKGMLYSIEAKQQASSCERMDVILHSYW